MSRLSRIIAFIKETLTSGGNPLFLSISPGLPGFRRVPGTRFSIIDDRGLQVEQKALNQVLQDHVKSGFSSSVADILSGDLERRKNACATLEQMVQDSPLQESAVILNNRAVAHALIGGKNNIEASFHLISVAYERSFWMVGSLSELSEIRSIIGDNLAAIRQICSKLQSGPIRRV